MDDACALRAAVRALRAQRPRGVRHLSSEDAARRGARRRGTFRSAGVIRRIALSLVLILPSAAASQIPRLPRGRPGTPQPQRQQRDTLADSTRIKWPAPDTVMQQVLSKQGYSITRYMGDTAYFDANKRVLDLLASKQRQAVVDRDSQTVV